MRLHRLDVEHFGCVDTAQVRFGPGLNVLYGPNDLGKSTLARALRSVLLLQHGSSAAEAFKPWQGGGAPEAALLLEVGGRYYRVGKSWGVGKAGNSTLEWSNDGVTFARSEEGRAVDGEVRRLLGWGIPAPGGKGGTHGLPRSFLASVLLGEQGTPYSVLAQSLKGDAEISGRDRLTDALQAMATDPMFSGVLAAAQRHVDEAFTPKGRPKQTSASPFRKSREEILRRQEAYEQLASRVQESTAVSDRLRELDAERDRLMSAAEAARERSRGIDRNLARQTARAAAQRRLDEARTRLQELQHAKAELARLNARRDVVNEALPVATEAQAAAESRRQVASDSRSQALAAAQAGDAEQQLQLETLKHRLEGLEDARRRAASADEARERVDTLQRELEAAQASRNEALQRAEAIEATLIAARLREASAAREQIQQTLDRVAQLQREATQLHADPGGSRLPSAGTMEKLRARHEELKFARARLGGGLSVEIGLHVPVAVRARVDDGDLEAIGAGEVEAERSVSLDIGDVASVRVVAGDADVRTSAKELEAKWDKDLAPKLKKAKLATYQELAEAFEEVSRGKERAEALRKEASTLAGAAGDVDAARAREDEARRALEACAGKPLAEVVEESALGEARAAQTLARDQAAAIREQLAAVEAKLQDLGAPDFDEAQLEQLFARRIEAEAALADAAARAEATLTSATEELSAAQKLEEAARATAAKLRDDLAACEGEIRVRREQAERGDEDTAHAEVVGLEEELAGLPAPAESVDESMQAQAHAALETAQQRLEDALDEVRKQEGALQQVGGDVVRERAESARDALEAAQRREAELELEYGAWKLLRDTLREAENEAGRHLGDALGQQVGERFARLTGGRYGALELTAHLETRGVRSAGGARDVMAMSEGVKEQLATILRVSVAEQLDSALVLDDHLTQTDPARIDWFREQLRDVARSIQIIVLTCRPDDYLRQDERAPEGEVGRDFGDRLRVIDLERVIRRGTLQVRADVEVVHTA